MIKILEKNRKFALIFTAIIALEIFLVSSIPGNAVGTGKLDISVAYHIIAFFLLNFFLLISLNGKNNIKTKYMVIAFLLSAAYAVLDEIHQIFVPLRYPSLGDIIADGIGILLATTTYFYSKKQGNLE